MRFQLVLVVGWLIAAASGGPVAYAACQAACAAACAAGCGGTAWIGCPAAVAAYAACQSACSAALLAPTP